MKRDWATFAGEPTSTSAPTRPLRRHRREKAERNSRTQGQEDPVERPETCDCDEEGEESGDQSDEVNGGRMMAYNPNDVVATGKKVRNNNNNRDGGLFTNGKTDMERANLSNSNAERPEDTGDNGDCEDIECMRGGGRSPKPQGRGAGLFGETMDTKSEGTSTVLKRPAEIRSFTGTSGLRQRRRDRNLHSQKKFVRPLSPPRSSRQRNAFSPPRLPNDWPFSPPPPFSDPERRRPGGLLVPDEAVASPIPDPELMRSGDGRQGSGRGKSSARAIGLCTSSENVDDRDEVEDSERIDCVEVCDSEPELFDNENTESDGFEEDETDNNELGFNVDVSSLKVPLVSYASDNSSSSEGDGQDDGGADSNAIGSRSRGLEQLKEVRSTASKGGVGFRNLTQTEGPGSERDMLGYGLDDLRRRNAWRVENKKHEMKKREVADDGGRRVKQEEWGMLRPGGEDGRVVRFEGEGRRRREVERRSRSPWGTTEDNHRKSEKGSVRRTSEQRKTIGNEWENRHGRRRRGSLRGSKRQLGGEWWRSESCGTESGGRPVSTGIVNSRRVERHVALVLPSREINGQKRRGGHESKRNMDGTRRRILAVSESEFRDFVEWRRARHNNTL